MDALGRKKQVLASGIGMSFWSVVLEEGDGWGLAAGSDQAVVTQFLAQGAAVDAEAGGCATLVVVATFQYASEQGPLNLAHHQVVQVAWLIFLKGIPEDIEGAD